MVIFIQSLKPIPGFIKTNSMKQKFTLIALAFTGYSLVVNGQIKKESLFLGGQVAYAHSKLDYSGAQADQKNSSANLNVSIGKAVKENAVFGVILGYAPFTTSYSNGSNTVNSTTREYNLGIFYRQYHQLAKDFYFFTEAGAAYIASKQSNKDAVAGTDLGTIKQSGGQLSLMPGLSYRVLPKLHLEIVIPNIVAAQYMVGKNNTSAPLQKQTQFSFNSSLNSIGWSNLSVGFHFIL